MFLDIATCHPHIELSSVWLAWFPPNSTSVTQPMDQGITNCMRINYHKLLMQLLLTNMQSLSSAAALANSISVFDAVI
jgi:hypothetical protein